MENIFGIDYAEFNDTQIAELSKIPKTKCWEQSIKILEFLKQYSNELIMKKDLWDLFDEHKNTVDKYVSILENVCAITYRKVGTSYVYMITPVGEKMLDILKKMKGEKKLDEKTGSG